MLPSFTVLQWKWKHWHLCCCTNEPQSVWQFSSVKINNKVSVNWSIKVSLNNFPNQWQNMFTEAHPRPSQESVQPPNRFCSHLQRSSSVVFGLCNTHMILTPPTKKICYSLPLSQTLKCCPHCVFWLLSVVLSCTVFQGMEKNMAIPPKIVYTQLISSSTVVFCG